MTTSNLKDVELAVAKSETISETCRRLGERTDGNSRNKVIRMIRESGADTSHFTGKARQTRKYQRVTKTCPVCNTEFKTRLGHKSEKTTCSRGCANSFFRSGVNHPNWSDGNSSYRTFALAEHGEKCNRCGWSVAAGALQVHHVDRDRSNNEISNLEVLCPNCHTMEHYLAGDGPFLGRTIESSSNGKAPV